MLFLHGLASDAESLGNLRKGPAIVGRPLDGDVFDAVGKAAERSDGGERVGGIVGDGELRIEHE